MQTAELESHVYADYDDQFQWFVWIAFVCLILDLLLFDLSLIHISEPTRPY